MPDPDWYVRAKAEGRILSDSGPAKLPGTLPVSGNVDSRKSSKSREKRDLLPAAFVPPGTWLVPLYVQAGDNDHRGLKAHIGRKGHEKKAVYRCLARQLAQLARYADSAQDGSPVKITLTRVGGNKMDPSNVVAALKYVQDAVADFLGVDDGAKNLDWRYAAEPGPRKYGVRIELELP